MSGLNIKQGDFAEKSPGVHYANWKEDILLKKKLQTLNRTEKNLVHRIKVDQKVLFKRFQNKLHRSKLTKARLWGDKETERELRGVNLHGLNVDIVNSEKDYKFLEQLDNRPCITNGYPPTEVSQASRKKDSVVKKKKKTVKQLDTMIQNVFEEPVIQTKPRVRSKSFTEGIDADNGITPRSNTVLQLPSLSVRPSTTSGARYDNVDIVIPDFRGDVFKPRDKTGNSKSKMKKANGKTRKLQVNFHNTRPKTCSPYLLNGTPKEGEVSPARSRRQSFSKNVSVDKSQRKSSLFEKEDKIDVTNILLEGLKSIDHTSKIKSFCESVKDQSAVGAEHADYYTIRLQAAMKEIQGYRPVSVPGTPEEEYGRHMGNLDVLSLTFKSLNFDFSRRDHSYTDCEAPDFVPMVYSSSDYSSDEDD